MVTAVLAAAIIGALYLFLRYGKYGIWIRATTQDRVMAAGHGHPGAARAHGGLRASAPRWRRRAGVLFGPLGGVTQNMGLDFTLRAFIVVVVGGMGNLGGSILASIFISLLEAYASLIVSPAQAVIVSFVALILTLLFRPTGLFVPTPEVTTCRRPSPRPHGRDRRYWIGFAVVLALLVIAPLVLPEFWRRFVTEILIWGLLAMSSDILIGYTGMVSFGHSAFFGLGMYGAAAALLSVQAAEPLARRALRPRRRRRGRGLRRLLRHAAARHLLLDHDARLLADLLRHHLHLDGGDRRRERPHLQRSRRSRIPGLVVRPASRTETLHWFVLAVVTISYLAPAPHHALALRHGAPGHPGERAAHAGDRLPRRALQDGGGHALRAASPGSPGVLYAIQNKFAAPDFVFFLVSGEVVIFNVMGGHRHAGRPHRRAPPSSCCCGRALSRFFTEYYLIPVGIIFTAMVIFMPQGLLGFLRRRLND